METSPVIHRKKLICIDIISMVLMILFDQWTKNLAVAHLKGKESISLIKGWLELTYVENRGAAFGILQNQRILLLTTTIILLIVCTVALIKLKPIKKNIPYHILIVLVIAGGIGNMIDRMLLGYVVDFVYFSIIDFPVFNVADCYITGAEIFLILFFLCTMFKEGKEVSETNGETNE